MDTIIVKMGEIKIARDAILTTYGVGSCVAIILCDQKMHIAGMAHAMLTTEKATQTQIATNALRYVELAIPSLIAEMEREGCERKHLVAYIAGGAQMFTLYRDPSNAIGPHNIEAAKRTLTTMGIPILQEDTGGKSGRNVRFDTSTGEWTIDAKR